MKAKLKPVMMEVYTSNRGYHWVEGYQVVTPEGLELQPHMRKRNTNYDVSASNFCKNMGWHYEIIK